MKNSILYSEMIPERSWEEQFNNWYDTEHIPLRMKVDGFQKARRYREINSNKYLALYEMDDLSVMDSQQYKEIKEKPSDLTQRMLTSVEGFTRYVGDQISEQINVQVEEDPYDAPILYPVMFEVPSEREEEFNDWYITDHVPTLLKNPNWLACRRYRIKSGEPKNWTHIALHYLTNTKVLESKERQEARKSSWRDKLAKEEWFKGSYFLFEYINSFTSKK
ncbi:DUF4286 family protein [Alteribacillus sp. YIM 98480]|uniref:DUF4286 family protein n=1 Tax=Alteribacillus sp. YIM 98480 TaxID=2606599 RepID=UPI00131C0193|nr:DUF4286 family protein [Alteribacillus sp. YIM 98480]